MYPGHFAAGLALKAVEPKAPTWGLMVGVGLLDLVFGVLVIAGIEGGGLHDLRTPWSHSLLMSLVWSALFGALFWRRGWRVVAVIAAAVMSHYTLDLVSHDPDMQLWPHSRVALGYGWLFGGLGGWLEVGVTIAGVAVYALWAARPANHRRRWGVVAAVAGVTLTLELLAVNGVIGVI